MPHTKRHFSNGRNYAVDSLGQNKLNNFLKKWVQIFHSVEKLIRFLSKQYLPFRVHVETIKPNDASNNSGNFTELTKLLSNYDPVLREHVVRCQCLTHGGACVYLMVNRVTYRHKYKMMLTCEKTNYRRH